MLRAAAGYSPDTIRDKLLQAADEQGDYPVLHEICKDADTLLGATIAFTMIEGGTSFNVMPKKAVLTANVRVSCTEKAEEITEKLKKPPKGMTCYVNWQAAEMPRRKAAPVRRAIWR